MKYDAFISYRHSELDMYVAKRIHKLLETFKVPRSVQKKSGKKKIQRVFRDQEELPIGSSLTNNIELALENSEYLIVICSHRAVESEWVQKEIDTFIRMHDREHVLAVLVEGEPNEAFPQKLLVDDKGNPVEPLAADVRGASRGEIKKKINTEVVRLAAPILSCSYDDLRQRHRERRMRKMAAVLTGVAAMGIAFGVYSTISASLIRQNLMEKQISQSKYMAEKAFALLEEGDRKNAALIALEALGREGNDRPYVADAQYALSKALNSYNLGQEFSADANYDHSSRVVKFDMSSDGKYIASFDVDGRIHLWDNDKKERLLLIDSRVNKYGVINIIDVYYTDFGFVIVYKDKACLFDIDGNVIWESALDEIQYSVASYDRSLIVICNSDVVNLINPQNGEVLRSYSNSDDNYRFGRVAISDDDEYLGVAYGSKNDEDSKNKKGRIDVFELNGNKVKTIKTKTNLISDLKFINNNRLIVESFDGSADYTVGAVDLTYELIGVEDGKQKWEIQYQFDTTDRDNHIFSYNPTTNRIAICDTVDIYIVDADSGQLVNKMRGVSEILNIYSSRVDDNGYICDMSGQISVFSFDKAELILSELIKCNDGIRAFASKGGEIAVQCFSTNDLITFRCTTGAGFAQKQEYEEDISKVFVSRNGSTYGVLVKDSGNYIFKFYNCRDELLYEVADIGIVQMIENGCFIDDSNFVYMDEQDILNIIDTGNKEVRTIALNSTMLDNVVFDADGNFVVAYGWDEYHIVDLLAEKVVYQGKFSNVGAVDKCIYSDKRKQLYIINKDIGLGILDLASDGELIDSFPEYKMIPGDSGYKNFKMDSNEKYLIMPCLDKKCKIFDLDKMETLCEIPFDISNSAFLEFLPDERSVIIKGNDNLYKIYDFIAKDYIYISNKEIEAAFLDLKISEDGNKFIISLESTHNSTYAWTIDTGLLILDGATYEVIDWIDYGAAYNNESNTILCFKNKVLYEFPYMDVDTLVEEAKKQFGDITLSDDFKIKYNID